MINRGCVRAINDRARRIIGKSSEANLHMAKLEKAIGKPDIVEARLRTLRFL